jgi:hypothetical protein
MGAIQRALWTCTIKKFAPVNVRERISRLLNLWFPHSAS